MTQWSEWFGASWRSEKREDTATLFHFHFYLWLNPLQPTIPQEPQNDKPFPILFHFPLLLSLNFLPSIFHIFEPCLVWASCDATRQPELLFTPFLVCFFLFPPFKLDKRDVLLSCIIHPSLSLSLSFLQLQHQHFDHFLMFYHLFMQYLPPTRILLPSQFIFSL